MYNFIQIAKNLTLSYSFDIHGTHRSVSLLNVEGLLKSPGALSTTGVAGSLRGLYGVFVSGKSFSKLPHRY
jgi:hypothetical protein